MNDANLIRRLQLRDDKAFNELVEEYQQKIFNTCYGFLHNREEAEDVAQEVFIQVYTSISKFRGESKLSTWIYRISVNRSLNKIRSRKSKFLVALDSVFESGGGNLDKASQTETPYDSLENKERAQVLHEAIDKLPKNQRSVFILSKYRGLSNKQIAEVMELTLSSVEALQNRAKKSLRKNLVDYYNFLLK